MNFAFAPTTLTTGCSPIVFVTTPPHPASNARRMLLSDSVGGADERRNGFSNRIPVKVTDLAGMGLDPLRRNFMALRPARGRRDATRPWAEEVRRQGLGSEHTPRVRWLQRRTRQRVRREPVMR